MTGQGSGDIGERNNLQAEGSDNILDFHNISGSQIRSRQQIDLRPALFFGGLASGQPEYGIH
ncbi:hypothetical protein D3C79_948050 [compost metagenome]